MKASGKRQSARPGGNGDMVIDAIMFLLCGIAWIIHAAVGMIITWAVMLAPAGIAWAIIKAGGALRKSRKNKNTKEDE